MRSCKCSRDFTRIISFSLLVTINICIRLYAGECVSLSGDGKFLALGAPGPGIAVTSEGLRIGFASVFEYDGLTFTPLAEKLVGTNYSGFTPQQGRSILKLYENGLISSISVVVIFFLALTDIYT